jgi:aarF domain-containing kinase
MCSPSPEDVASSSAAIVKPLVGRISIATSSSSIAARLGKVALSVVLTLALLACLLYICHQGFRRTVQFWTLVSPILVEYKMIKYRAAWLGQAAEESPALAQFHQRSAPKIVAITMQLGGIYVKIGQFLSTVGGAMLDDAYVQALKRLQDGLPPRPLSKIAPIIQESLQLSSIYDVFESFEELPVGAASIAQAHKAVWKETGETVMVKVQYPDVEAVYEADFNNLELVMRWVNPDQLGTAEILRQRHRNELDFRLEAQNLQECSANMQRRQLEPQQVRIPKVIHASKQVLVMEYLEGTSLKDAMEEELQQIAVALGLQSAQALRAKVMEDLKLHFLEGGGTSNSILKAGTPMIRGYASMVRKASNLRARIRNGAARVAGVVSAGHWVPEFQALHIPTTRIDLGRVLKTLIMVHGVQVILDGVYNIDPREYQDSDHCPSLIASAEKLTLPLASHNTDPGNVIIMKDGKLGLIDYGMVGRLQPQQREWVASAVLALHVGDQETVVNIYRESGFVAGWVNGPDHDDCVIHRFACFHLNKFDLSPLIFEDGQVWPVLEVFSKTIERTTPDWIVQMKRIGGLMIGVSSQAGRPISLAKEWSPMAHQFRRETGSSPRRKRFR